MPSFRSRSLVREISRLLQGYNYREISHCVRNDELPEFSPAERDKWAEEMKAES